MKKMKNLMLAMLVAFVTVGTVDYSNNYVSYASSASSSSSTKDPNKKEPAKTEDKTNYNKVPEVTMTGNELSTGLENIPRGETFGNILTQYRGVVTFISGIALISMIMFFIFNLIALGNSKGNPQERQKAIQGLIVSGIATAGLGSVTLITTLFYNFMKK